MYSRITVHTKSWNAFFRIRATSFLPQTAGKEQRVWPLCELVRFDYSIWNRNLSISRLLGRFFAFYDRKKDGYMSPSLTAKNKNRLKRRLEAVEKLSFFEQPLDRNHAFDRMLKKNRVLRTHFFFPCIKTEVHAPGFYEFAAQILFYACCRTKHKIEIWLFRQAAPRLWRGVCFYNCLKNCIFTSAATPFRNLFLR